MSCTTGAGPPPAGDRARMREGVKRALPHPLRIREARTLALDAFTARFAVRHGLRHESRREMPGGSLFLAGVLAERAHSFLLGRLDGGAEGVAFFVETAVDERKGLTQGWTVARFAVPEAAGCVTGLACGPRLTPAWGGRVRLAGTVPDQLNRTRLGDAGFDERHEIGCETPADASVVGRLLTPAFRDWLQGLSWGRHGELRPRLELRRDVLCVWQRGKASTEADLALFLQRADHVAAQVRRLTPADTAAISP